MKTKICLYIIILSGILQFGCSNQCCDCEKNGSDGSGNLLLIRNWENLWKGLSAPGKLDVYFYCPYQDLYHQSIYDDSTMLSLNEGEYSVFAINDDVHVSGMWNFSTAKITIPYHEMGNKYYTSEAPMIMAAFTTTYVDNYGISKCIVAPSPIVSVINFRFIIEVDSLVGAVKECKAELNGVITSKMLSGERDTGNIYAIIPFTAQQTTNGTFDKKVSILGLSDIDNILNISIRCENEEKNVNVDLTRLFNFEFSGIQNCVIQIQVKADLINAVVENITIEDWDQNLDDNIELK